MSSTPTCALPPPELRARQAELRAELSPGLLEVEELADGFRFWFDATAERLAQLAEVMAFEKDCCSFLDFRLEVAAGASRASLTVVGERGTKPTIEALFVESVVGPTAPSA